MSAAKAILSPKLLSIAARDGLILRRARKAHRCTGDGSMRDARGAADCVQTIQPGEQYIECVWESSPFQTGSAHCLICAETFYDAHDPQAREDSQEGK